MHVLIGIALKSLLIAGLTLGLLAADEVAFRGRAVVGRPYRPVRAGDHGLCAAGRSRRWNVEAPAISAAAAAAGRRNCRRRDDRPTVATPTPCRVTAAAPSGSAPAAPRPSLSAAAAAIGALRGSRGDPAVHHLPRAGAADCPPRPRRRPGRRPLAERARPRAAADGVQARHRIAHQRRSCFADQLGPDAPGDPAQQPRGRGDRRSRSDHRPRARARRPDGLDQAAARPRRDRPVLVQPVRLAAGPRSASAARGNGRRHACSRPISPIPIMRSCWSASPATNAPACCSERTASPHRKARSQGVSPACSTASRFVARSPAHLPLGVFFGAVLVAAPLAALTLTPAAPKPVKAAASPRAVSQPQVVYPVAAKAEEPTDLPSIIAQGVSTSVTTAVAAATAVAPKVVVKQKEGDYRVEAKSGATVESVNGTVTSRAPSGASVTVYPADAQGRRKIVAVAPNGATAISYADAEDVRSHTRPRSRDRSHDRAQGDRRHA